MNERSEQDGQAADAKFARRKRIAERVARALGLFHASLSLLIFLIILRTGYLSWIGITVGVLYVLPGFAAPLVGFAGKRRIEAFLSWLSMGEPILLALVVGLASIWPEQNDSSWRPLSFDAELAAVEAQRAVPPEENAAVHYDSLFAKMDVNGKPDFLFQGTVLRHELGDHPWRGDDHPEASEWLGAHSENVDKLLVIGRMKKCRWPVQAYTYDTYTIPFDGLRQSVSILAAAGSRDFGEGRIGSAMTKYFCVLGIADHLFQQPSVMDSHIGLAVERAALEMIRRALVEEDLSGSDLARIADHLPSAADFWHQQWESLRPAEELRYMNFLARAYEVDDEGHVRFARGYTLSSEDEKKPGERKLERALRVYWPMSMPLNPQGVWSIADRYFARFSDLLDSECPPLCDWDETFWHAAPRMIANFHRWGAETLFFPEREYVRLRHKQVAQLVRRRGTWLVLGVRRYRNAHGAWPSTLDAISEYVPAEAFFDPTAGEAFVYGLDGDSFRLYSKGLNRVDEGGRQGYVRALKKAEDDIPIWPPPEPEPESEPSEEEQEEMMKQLEEIYGPGYVETYMKDKGSDQR